MRRIILALVLATAACDGRVDPQLVETEAAPDGGVVANKQAVVLPGYTINWNEDRWISWNATYEHFVSMQVLGRGKLQYYFNSPHVGVIWEWSMDEQATWHQLLGVESHANNSTTSIKQVGSGLRGCWEGIGCVTLPAPMVDWTVYHHQSTWNSGWTPPGTDPVLPHGPVSLRKRYVIECPTAGVYSRPLATGIAVRLDTAPQYLNIAYTSSAPASGVFIAPQQWKDIATDCNYGVEAFDNHTYCTTMTDMHFPYCFTWPGI